MLYLQLAKADDTQSVKEPMWVSASLFSMGQFQLMKWDEQAHSQSMRA